jgi:hippurate hydrolase
MTQLKAMRILHSKEAAMVRFAAIMTHSKKDMGIIDSFADVERFVAIRRDLHAHPELGFEEHRTSDKVAALLESWGIKVHRHVAGTGLVGVIRNGKGTRSIGLRADMDALPLQEANQFAHRSRHDGRMHACGHDGHTTMLLAAAWHLAQSRDFDGTVNFIFQPAEEMGKAGARKMIQEGLFERFPCDAVFALHNFPLGEVGCFALNEGAMMASSNTFRVALRGVGTHASIPHTGIDPVAAVLSLAQALQGLVPRSIDGAERALLAVTQLQGSPAPNVIPDLASVGGTVRTFSVAALDLIEARLRTLATHTAQAFGCTAETSFERASPPLVNHPAEARFAAAVMRELVGADLVNDNFDPIMGAEDFAHMLLARPGCYVFLGNGDGAHRLDGHGGGPCITHNTSFDFNDKLIPIGASYFVRLAERWLPLAAVA